VVVAPVVALTDRCGLTLFHFNKHIPISLAK
jgi:hypothetical protein